MGTLANDTILEGAGLTLTQDCYINSVWAYISIRNLTDAEVPLDFGYASQELSITEINEFLDASPTSPTDVPAIEHAKRRVRLAGRMSESGNDLLLLNNGRMIKIKLGWIVPSGKALPQLWIKNKSGATLTTGAIVTHSAIYHGNWR